MRVAWCVMTREPKVHFTPFNLLVSMCGASARWHRVRGIGAQVYTDITCRKKAHATKVFSEVTCKSCQVNWLRNVEMKMT
jgi:hypothetical protein